MKLTQILEDILKTVDVGQYKFIFEKNPKDKKFVDYKIYMTDSKGLELVACWLAKIYSSEIYIEYIGVSGDNPKGSGLGSKLMSKVIEFCKDEGFDKLTLKMDTGMGCPSNDQKELEGKQLYKFYSRFGFEFSWTQEECDEDEEKSPCAMTLYL